MLTKKGIVVSTKMQKTIKVHINRKIMHPIYKKIVNKVTTLFAHDENEQAKTGNTVILRSSRPISKKKHWILQEIIE